MLADIVSEAFGLGDGLGDLSDSRTRREPRAGARLAPRDHSRWPTAGGILRVLAATLAVIAVVGWLLTAFNG